MLDNQQIKNNWPKIKSLVLSHWDKLSESEVEKTHGSVKALGALIEDSYGAREDFDSQYERLCHSILTPKKTTVQRHPSEEFELSEKFMDKDRDENYLLGPNGVTRKAETQYMKELSKKSVEESGLDDTLTDGYHNAARHSDEAFREEEELLKPDLHGLEAEDAVGTPVSAEELLKSKKHTHLHKQKHASDEFTPNQAPQSKDEDIILGRSNSSANTTSHSALKSSEAMSKDTKKL